MEAVDGSQYPFRLGILIKRSQANPFIQTERHSTRRDTSSEAKKEEIPGGGAAKGKRPIRDPQKNEEDGPKRRKKQKTKQRSFPLFLDARTHPATRLVNNNYPSDPSVTYDLEQAETEMMARGETRPLDHSGQCFFLLVRCPLVTSSHAPVPNSITLD
jgi:hypothetical protein